jgi:hypothetical protein
MVEHYTEIECDGAGCPNRFRINKTLTKLLVHREAQKEGWRYVQLHYKPRDLCPDCVTRWSAQIAKESLS